MVENKKHYFNIISLLLFGILNIVFFIGISSIKNYFFSDDLYYFYDCHRFLAGYLDFWELFFHRFLSHIYYFIGYRIFGMNPEGFHIVSFLLHLVNTILVYKLFIVLFKKKTTAFLTALFFSFHYANNFAILAVGCIDELLVTFFYLSAFIFFAKYLTSGKIINFNWSLLFFLCGFAVKQTIVTFSFLALTLDLIINQGRISSKKIIIFKRNILFFAITAVYIYFHVSKYPSYSQADKRFFELFVNPGQAINIMASFFKIIFIPFDFQPKNTFFLEPEFHSVRVSMLIIALLLGIFIVVKDKRYKFGLAWVFFTVLPFLTPLGPVLREKDIYFPLIGGCFLFAATIVDWAVLTCGLNKRKLSIALILFSVVLLILFSISSFYRAKDFKLSAMIVKKARLDLRNFLFDDKIEEGIVYILDRPAWINRASAFPSRSNFLFQRHAEVNNKKFIFVDFDDDSFQNLGEELYCFSISKKRNELKNWRDFEENDYLTDDKIGLDGIFPSSIKRYFFYYRNGRLYNITDKVFPNTEITFNVKTDNINELALVGDFNSWNPKSHRLTKIGNNIWQVSLSLSPGKYAYKFLVDGKNWVNNPNSDFYCDIPSFGISSCLGVVNYSLPFGLLSQADNTYVEKVIKLRKELIFYPESAILHEQIAELYLEKNYNFESLAEFNVARELERAGKL